MRAQTLKGVGGSVVILEEAAYCDLQLIREVVVPLLAMETSVLLCISTLLESTNHYSRFFQMKKPGGEPLFNCIQFSLVCSECMKTDHPERCTHKLHELPRWLSAAKIEVIREMLNDDPAMFLRESMGISADATTRAFREEKLLFLENTPKRGPPSNVGTIFVSIDPAGGGNSAFAICSLLHIGGGMMVSVVIALIVI